jgi:hypothetical protein
MTIEHTLSKRSGPHWIDSDNNVSLARKDYTKGSGLRMIQHVSCD